LSKKDISRLDKVFEKVGIDKFKDRYFHVTRQAKECTDNSFMRKFFLN